MSKRKKKRSTKDPVTSNDKHLTHLDEEFILSHGFSYGLFDSETLWKKGSDGNDWWCRISLWNRLVTWYYVTEINNKPRTVEYGYLTKERFYILFR